MHGEADAAAASPGVVALDLSRLVSRAGRQVPTGIDRVELAYAQHLIAAGAPHVFAAMTRWGAFGLLPQRPAQAYVAAIAQSWRSGAKSPDEDRRIRRLARLLRAAAPFGSGGVLQARLRAATSVYLLVSHHHLDKRAIIERIRGQGRVRFICFIHDLIPIEFPEYARPGQDVKHQRRIETAAALADAVIVNSAVTRDAFLPYLDRQDRFPPVFVAPLGTALTAVAADGPSPQPPPYFVCFSTIEARKNHLMLLNLWRRLADERGDAAPRLVLVGQRGWESENAVDMLDRCRSLRGVVIEYNGLPDTEAARLLQGARALLLPSFAEGFGFPLVEALGLGVPVLCSAIPALRESGGEVPEFLDPLDGPGWLAAVLDYCPAESPRRAAQLRRLAGWRPRRWEDHFREVDALIAETAARPPVP